MAKLSRVVILSSIGIALMFVLSTDRNANKVVSATARAATAHTLVASVRSKRSLLGLSVESLAVNASGSVFVVTRWPSAVLVLTKGRGKFSKRILASSDRYPIAATADADTIWIAFRLPDPRGRDGVVAVLHGSIKQFTFRSGGGHHLTAIGARGSNVWTGAARGVWKLNALTGRSRYYPLPGSPTAIAVSRTNVWIALGGQSLVKVGTNGGFTKMVKHWSDGATPYIAALAFDRSGRLWFAGTENATYGVVDARGHVQECHAMTDPSTPAETKHTDILPWGEGAFFVTAQNPHELLYVTAGCSTLAKIDIAGAHELSHLAGVGKERIWVTDQSGPLWEIAPSGR